MSSDADVQLREWNTNYPALAQEQMLKIEGVLKNRGFLGDYDGNSSYHMGSTSIKGMLGKPMIDITVLSNNLLPDIPDEVIADLKQLGYEYAGPAPHNMNKYFDQWFHKINSPEVAKSTGNKGFAAHIVTSSSMPSI